MKSEEILIIVLIIVLVCGCGLLIQPCRDTFTVGATGSVSDNNAIRSGTVTEVCTGRKIGGTCNGLTPESNEFEGTCKKNKGEEEEGECGSPFSAGKNEEVEILHDIDLEKMNGCIKNVFESGRSMVAYDAAITNPNCDDLSRLDEGKFNLIRLKGVPADNSCSCTPDDVVVGSKDMQTPGFRRVGT